MANEIEVLRGLVAQWRESASRLDRGFGPGDSLVASGRRWCADELDAALAAMAEQGGARVGLSEQKNSDLPPVEAIRDALRKAFRYGERHQEDATSVSHVATRRSIETLAKFKKWADKTSIALASENHLTAPAECTNRGRCDCIGACKHGRGGNGAEAPPGAQPEAQVGGARFGSATTPPERASYYKPDCSGSATTPPPGAVPEGWRLVPVEPTIAMLIAGDIAAGRGNGRLTKPIYAAMLAAAPGPEPSDAPR